MAHPEGSSCLSVAPARAGLGLLLNGVLEVPVEHFGHRRTIHQMETVFEDLIDFRMNREEKPLSEKTPDRVGLFLGWLPFACANEDLVLNMIRDDDLMHQVEQWPVKLLNLTFQMSDGLLQSPGGVLAPLRKEIGDEPSGGRYEGGQHRE